MWAAVDVGTDRFCFTRRDLLLSSSLALEVLAEALVVLLAGVVPGDGQLGFCRLRRWSTYTQVEVAQVWESRTSGCMIVTQIERALVRKRQHETVEAFARD
jgi:hypothetical protein